MAYMQIRARNLLYCGIIPRLDSIYSEAHRQWWARRLIYEYNVAPFKKSRETPCRG